MRVISPTDIEPAVNVRRPELGDKASHRRVLSPMNGGPGSMDAGYNRYAGGLDYKTGGAYFKDEFCYTSEGLMESLSWGVPQVSAPGMFMWRPRFAVTDSLRVRADAVTVCVFGPAREDAVSHVVPADQLPSWDGKGKRPPIPLRKHYSQVSPSPFPFDPDSAEISHRVIWSREIDGSEHMEVSHTMVWAPVALTKVRSDRDELWWLEKGEMEIRDEGGSRRMRPHDFLFRTAGETIDQIGIAAGSVIIGYAAHPK